MITDQPSRIPFGQLVIGALVAAVISLTVAASLLVCTSDYDTQVGMAGEAGVVK